MAIMQAGPEVEAAVAAHSHLVDDTMLELLARRMEAARHMEQRPEVLEGLGLLWRR
jgi:hypothetical protein